MRPGKQLNIIFLFFFILFLGSALSSFAATISGNVVLEAGGYPGSVDIYFTLFSKDPWMNSACESMSSNTDAFYNEEDGTYVLSNVAAGEYYLQIEAAGGVNLVREWATGTNTNSVEDCAGAVAITVSENDVLLDYNFQLAPGGTVNGFVQADDTEIGLEGVWVNVSLQSGVADGCSESNRQYKGTYSQNDGSFEITGLPLDAPVFIAADPLGRINYIKEWALSPTSSSADCAQAFPFSATASEPLVTAEFSLDPGSVISGTVMDTDGNPMQNVLFALDAVPDRYEPCSIDQSRSLLPQERSAVDGSYTIQGVAPGTYTLKAMADDWSYLSEYWADPQSVNICCQAGVITVSAGGEVYPGKDFQLDLESSIAGTITDANGDPVEGVLVTVSAAGTCDTYSFENVAWTNSSGIYTVSGLPVGDHYLAVLDLQGRYFDEYWDNVHDFAQATPVAITMPGQVVGGIDIQLDLGSRISGTITKYDGSSLTADELSHLQVQAYPDSGNPCQLTDTINGTVNSDGTYFVARLPNGEYRVVVSSDGSVNYMPAYSVGANSESLCVLVPGTVSITSIGSSTTGVDFQMDPGATLQGIVSRDDTVPFTGDDFIVSLLVLDSAHTGDVCGSGTLVGGVQVSADGSYSISGLPPGKFSVYVTTNRWFSSLPDIVQEWATGDSLSSSPDCSQAEIFEVTAPGDIFDHRNFQVDFGGKVCGHVFEHDGVSINTDAYVVRFHPICDANTYLFETVNSSTGYTSPAMEAGEYYVSLFTEDRETFTGWASQSGASVSDCGDARTVTVIKEQTVPDIDFIVNRRAMPLVPIYMLLLNSSAPQ